MFNLWNYTFKNGQNILIALAIVYFVVLNA